MADRYVHIFGIPVEELKFKKEVLRHIECYCDENLPLAEDGPRYHDFDDFLLENATNLACVWIDGSDKPDGGIPYIIGVEPTYSWNRIAEPRLSSETRAREFIAKSLLPFVTQSKEELRDLCGYIETPLPTE